MTSELDTVPDLRVHADKLTKDLEKAQEALVTEQVKNRGFAARDAFKDAGYEPKFADLYVQAEPKGELTAEAIKVWTGTFGLEPETASEDGKDGTKITKEAPGSTALADLGRGGSTADGGAGSSTEGKRITVQEWQALTKTDPGAAREAVANGLVKLRPDNAWVRGYTLSPTGENPYILQNRPKT